MDEILKSAATQIPGLVVLCFLVQTFLRAQKERDALIQIMHVEHLSARSESRDAIRENTASNREVTKAIVSFQSSLLRGKPE